MEIWKPVKSYPGIKASSWGRIKLPKSSASMPNGGKRFYYPLPRYGVKTRASSKARHLYFGLQSTKFGNLKVHRLICEAFHGSPPFVNAVVIHLDENSLNNKAENLKWVTQKENLNMPVFID